MALAYRAGAPLKDMEFVQYHPTGLPFTGILITEATRAEGGWLLNKDGYRYLQDYDLGKPEPTPVLRSMELGPRDRLSQAFVHEVEKGRTIESPYGPIVHLDLRHLGAKLIDTKLPMVRELCMKYERIDPVKELIPVRPVVHYMMGGVHTDINGATPIDGLFAAGETACVTINGANRLGSNSLPECLVFGARAGKAAAEYAASAKPPPPVVMRQADDEVRRTRSDAVGRPGHRADRRHPRRDAVDHGGQCRDLPLRRLADQGHRSAGRVAAATRARPAPRQTRVFNTELVAALELANMLDIAETHPAVRAATRGVARRPPADRLHHARRHALPQSRAGLPRLGRFRQDRAVAGDDHTMATRRAGVREVATHGRQHSDAGDAV